MADKTPKTAKQTGGFSDDEKAAMKARAKELKAEERMNKNRAAGESAVREAIAAMTDSDQAVATRFHEIVEATAPQLMPKTWYGMPAYAKDGDVICFFQSAAKFKTRYSTIGFSDKANLDEGNLWPTSYALKELGPTEEAKLVELIKRALS